MVQHKWTQNSFRRPNSIKSLRYHVIGCFFFFHDIFHTTFWERISRNCKRLCVITNVYTATWYIKGFVFSVRAQCICMWVCGIIIMNLSNNYIITYWYISYLFFFPRHSLRTLPPEYNELCGICHLRPSARTYNIRQAVLFSIFFPPPCPRPGTMKFFIFCSYHTVRRVI